MAKKFLAAATVAAFSMTPAAADTLDDVIDRGTLRCGVVLDFPPIGYRDANNEPAGFDVEYCKELAKALGVEVELLPATWSERLPLIVTNRADVVVGSTSDALDRATTVEADFWRRTISTHPQVSRECAVISDGVHPAPFADRQTLKITGAF
ncbi:Cystine-binding periplasmic protein precursor [Roseovarius litorisediminis]|uniref:Cystine-binding periplasmic protein n=1 Tax=Roseovarius litorisediminis TaxID=1312363 RepID=A0A1Y5SCF9_9RHOB|nr:transporter substrate-binding domain-containing protein [Roseovarius litorisediminis]SLN37561.1 Cystine-binding periplasmic protein precursor [Roseovarius litorisediminis]